MLKKYNAFRRYSLQSIEIDFQMKSLSHLTRSSLILIVFFGLDKISAFVRSIIIARQFKLSYELDAFNVANNLPDLLFALISGGAMGMAFIPILSEYLTTRGRPALWDLFSRVTNLAFVVTGLLAIVIAIFATQIVRSQIGIAPGFGSQQQSLITELMRLNLVATLIFSISGLVMSGLQANQHFLLPAMAPLLYNLGQIFGAVFLSPTKPYMIGSTPLPALGLGVHGLVYGVILGAILHLFIQIPGLIRYQFHWTPAINIRHHGVLQVLKLVGPRLLTMLSIQLIFLARDNLASRLGTTGAITSLTYGWMIMQVPETLIGTAIATALLPTLAENATRQDWESFRQTIEKAIRILIALTIPITTVLATGLRPLVAVVFGFDASGTEMLTWTTRVYLLGLAGHTVLEVAARAFYARKDAIRPLIASVLNTVAFIGMGILMVNNFFWLGAPGIAIVELAFTGEALLLIFWLNRRLKSPISLDSTFIRALIGGLLGGALTYTVIIFLPGSPFLTASIGMLAGVLLALPFMIKELRSLLNL